MQRRSVLKKNTQLFNCRTILNYPLRLFVSAVKKCIRNFGSSNESITAHRTNGDIFLNKKSEPEKREKSYEQNCENNPTGGRNFLLDSRRGRASATRTTAAILVHHAVRFLINHLLSLKWILIDRRGFLTLSAESKFLRLALFGF